MSNKRELITWRGTPGVGDFMMALNCAHNYAFYHNKKVILEMQWEHDEDYLHHFEEEETIIERMEYIHKFYYRPNDVKVTHVFNAWGRYRDRSYFEDMVMLPNGRMKQKVNLNPKKRFYFESGIFTDKQGAKIPPNDWSFRYGINSHIRRWKKNNKNIVIWTPLLNAEVPRTWKNFLTYDEWQCIIAKLRAGGFNVIELTYRTPIREVMYHLMHCRMVICYDGMWHYIARNLQTPMVVLSTEGITSYHTPHAIKSSPREETKTNTKPYIFDLIEDIGTTLGKTRHNAINYHEHWIKDIFAKPDEDRQDITFYAQNMRVNKT